MKRRSIIYSFICMRLLSMPLVSNGQVGVGTLMPHASAILDVVSTNKGILMPKTSATVAQLESQTSNQNGLAIFAHSTAYKGFYFYENNNGWRYDKWDKLATTNRLMNNNPSMTWAYAFKSSPYVGISHSSTFMSFVDDWNYCYLSDHQFNSSVNLLLVSSGVLEQRSGFNRNEWEGWWEIDECLFIGKKYGSVQGKTIVFGTDATNPATPLAVKNTNTTPMQQWRDNTDLKLLETDGEGAFLFSKKGIKIDESQPTAVSGKGLLGMDGTLTVSKTTVDAKSRIYVANNAPTNEGHLRVVKNNGVGFTIVSSSVSDRSEVVWFIVQGK